MRARMLAEFSPMPAAKTKSAAASISAVLFQLLYLKLRTRDLAMFNLAMTSKRRGCEVVALKVEDITPNGYAIDRAITLRLR